MKRFAAVALAVVAGCGGNPQSLPVGMSACDARGAGASTQLVATVQNKGTKPLSRIDVIASFYRDFRYQDVYAGADVRPALDPGARREIALLLTNERKPSPAGRAIKCTATHLGYLDGTAQDASPPQ